MTDEGIALAGAGVQAEDERLFCYRHPQRETVLRCGRCERPICTGCAMQGPVGSRCRQCGKPAFDPLTSFTAQQLVLGIGVALAAGTLAGVIALRFGFLSVIVAFFAGGIVAEAVRRVTGYKHGPVMLAIVFLGIIVGTAVGFGLDYAFFSSDWIAFAETEAEARALMNSYLAESALWAIVAAAAGCFGAYTRLR